MTRRTFAVAVVLFLCAALASADEIRVATSGAFTAAYQELVPQFERATGHKVVSAFGGSMGSAPDAIPNRLARGEPFDIVIVASNALDDLMANKKVVAGSRVDLVRSVVAMAVRKGAPKPDIGTADSFKRTLLQAKSIAVSTSASGAYLSSELFPRLGIADAIKSKLRIVESGPVGDAVARGDAEIGFQQMSELKPVAGIDIVGPLPADLQRVTTFSAGIVAGTKVPAAARALISFFSSPAAVGAIRKSGLEPAAAEHGVGMKQRAQGAFDVKVTPTQADAYADGAVLGRMTIDKVFHGDLEATSKGQMLTAGAVEKGSAGYVAIEKVTGTLHGRSGTFALQHNATMTRGKPDLSITVVPDSATGELVGLSGTMNVIIENGKHAYDFEYSIAEKP